MTPVLAVAEKSISSAADAHRKVNWNGSEYPQDRSNGGVASTILEHTSIMLNVINKMIANCTFVDYNQLIN